MNTKTLIISLVILIGSIITAFILLARKNGKLKEQVTNLKTDIKKNEDSFNALLGYLKKINGKEIEFEKKEKPKDSTDRINRLNNINKL